MPFRRVGQYVNFLWYWPLPLAAVYCLVRKYRDGISDTRIVFRKELREKEPNFNPETKFAISNPDSGCVCPYGLTIAYAENAVTNGAHISLNTAVTGMDVQDGRITAVHTNRGTLRPALVINAAGVFSEEVARMAGDRFFSIHPRRGTNSILDRKAGALMQSIASIKGLQLVSKTHTKGGGILHTVHDNLLVGPDAVETYEKENTATNPESIERVFAKQKITMPQLTERDIITYFTGVRAALRRISSSNRAAKRTISSTAPASSRRGSPPRPPSRATWRTWPCGSCAKRSPSPATRTLIPAARAFQCCATWTTRSAPGVLRKTRTTA